MKTKILKFEIKAICESCKHLDWYDDDENDYPICKLSGIEINTDDTCELWELDKMLIKDTFWIKKLV